jgi:aminoglycoside/choline kinase family phosphotransferase
MRTDLLLQQTRMHFPRLDVDRIEINAIEKGGSDRKFYRIKSSPDQSIILVKYSLEREENRHYVRIAQFLAEHGIRAPKIYFHDPAEGLIWIEDLGEHDLFGYRNESWLVRRAFYESALDEAAKLHRLSDYNGIRKTLAGEFNAALYRWEQNYFFENCLGRYFKIDQAKLAAVATLPALREISEHLERFPRVLIHRDFQSQNIIIRNGMAHLIDFQGMRPGLAEYDLASLLYDPYVDLSNAERGELIAYYREQQIKNGVVISGEFDDKLRFCGLQRLMQALGAYGFLGLVRGHRNFLKHIPRALQSLRKIVAEIDNLRPLTEILAAIS